MVLGHKRHSTASNRSSTDESAMVEDETVIDDDQGNVLSHIISQLRPGADLSRVTLPTFILEPRSMLERITNFMAHPETLLDMPTIEDPVERFVAVTKFYLSGWHIRPPGVKKPLNPILGETFTGYWDYPDGTRGYYISEQTSHHPPKSSYFFAAPEHHIRIDGTLKPRSRFLGNSVGSFMEGIAVMRFTNRNERYFVTQPNMYARGILFGKMKYELGDHAFVRCPETGLEVDIEFKVKGWVGGTYNAIGGHIKDAKGRILYDLSGMWHQDMYIKDVTTGKKELLFDATNAKPSKPRSRPISEQAERESQRLWSKVTAAIRKGDHRVSTDEKTLIEDRQREEAAQRGEGIDWQPKLFRRALGAAGQGGPGDEEGEEKLDWVIDAKIDGKTPEEKVQQILAIAPILPGQKKDVPNTGRPPPGLAQKSNNASNQPSDGTDNLIDFGSSDQTSTKQPEQQQQQQQKSPHPPSPDPPSSNPSSGAETGLSFAMRPLEPQVLRTDSIDGTKDQFVDAES